VLIVMTADFGQTQAAPCGSPGYGYVVADGANALVAVRGSRPTSSARFDLGAGDDGHTVAQRLRSTHIPHRGGHRDGRPQDLGTGPRSTTT
jgi:hypothetical protein